AHRGHTNYERATPRELVNHMNEHTIVVIQIERQNAVENIDELLAVPGIDVALIGPLDLTVSLGEEDTNAPAVTSAIQHVLAATQRHNVAMGMHSSTPSVVVEWQRRGATMLTCGTDVGFFSAGAQQTVTALRTGNQASQTHTDTTIDI
ncbi:MAG: aldolase/citrate lyase family protein, partial [Chloroflexota bacterium]